MSDEPSGNLLNSIYDKTKYAFQNATTAVSDFGKNIYYKAENVMPSSTSSPSSGGRHRRRSKNRYYGGKFHANTPLNGIASNASPISGIQHTAKAHYVGGKRRRRRKSRRHRHTRHCKH